MLETGRDEGAEQPRGLTLAGLGFPAVGTLLATGAVSSMVCRTPDKPFATWWGLLLAALGFLGLAGAVHAAAVWGVARVYRRQLEAPPVGSLLRGLWMGVALLPLMVLLEKAGSVWATVVPGLIAAATVLYVRRTLPTAGRSAHAPAPEGIAPGVFAHREPPGLLRTLRTAVVLALLTDLFMAMLLSWQFQVAGLLGGAGVAVVLWTMPLRGRVKRTVGPWWRRGMAETVVALVLIVAALLPSYGGDGRVAGVARAVLQGPASEALRRPPVAVQEAPKGGALSGVILLLPPKPKQKEVPPPPVQRAEVGAVVARPRVIPFDGAYWYFRSPEVKPQADARVVKGDPLKVQIRSTDLHPLQMEAHQRMEPALAVEGLGGIGVVVRNGEREGGPILVSLSLESHADGVTRRESMGWQEVPSSEASARVGQAGTEETLRFAVPSAMRAGSYDELTVTIRPSFSRSRMGAHVAVERFELMP